ncbi:MAG: transposase, partial [Candidatus Midichloriaceae bacterium]|nr:transposase [Candidatus Midichloriaceae bacterium]
MQKYDITALFYCIDEFYKVYEQWEKQRLIPKLGKRERAGKLSISEMLCIEVMFHLSEFRDFKTF